MMSWMSVCQMDNYRDGCLTFVGHFRDLTPDDAATHESTDSVCGAEPGAQAQQYKTLTTDG